MAIETKRCATCTLDKPVDEFYPRGKGRRSRCILCEATTSKAWRLENPEMLALSYRNTHLKTTYGMTLEDYDTLFASQGGRCAICKTSEGGHGRSVHLTVDHDHVAGHVRGLLCHGCNAGLGNFKDNVNSLESAIEYLMEN